MSRNVPTGKSKSAPRATKPSAAARQEPSSAAHMSPPLGGRYSRSEGAGPGPERKHHNPPRGK